MDVGGLPMCDLAIDFFINMLQDFSRHMLAWRIAFDFICIISLRRFEAVIFLHGC